MKTKAVEAQFIVCQTVGFWERKAKIRRIASAAVPSHAELRSAAARAQMPPRIIDEIKPRYFK